LRLFSFGGYGLALAALALVVFGAIECPPNLGMLMKIFTIDRVILTHYHPAMPIGNRKKNRGSFLFITAKV